MQRGGGNIALAILACAAAILLLWPGAAITWHAFDGMRAATPHAASDSIPPPVLGAGTGPAPGVSLISRPVAWRTVAWPLGIGVLASAIAWPWAWMIRARPARAVWLIAPVAMPTYLASAALNLGRSPGTWLGDMLESSLGRGEPWQMELANKSAAMLGLALWSWPLAAAVLAGGARHIDQRVLDALRLDARSAHGATARIAARLQTLHMLAPSVLAAVGLVAFLMLGSAVPLHLAQVDTWSLRIWLAMDSWPADQRWRLWAACLASIAAAAVAALVIVRVVARRFTQPREQASSAASTLTWPHSTLCAVILLASTAAPALLLGSTLRSSRPLRDFVLLNRDALAQSGLVAACVGAIALVLGACTWRIMSDGSVRAKAAAWVIAAVFVAGALAPGVMVGAATNLAWNLFPHTRLLGDSPALLIMAHSARLGAIAVIAGAIAGAGEPRWLRDLRTLDGACGIGLRPLAGWLAVTWPRAGVVLASAIVVACLSLHEIEASIMVQAPGSASLARRVLEHLHYSRLQDLSAAAIWLVSAAVGLSAAAGALLWMMRQRNEETNETSEGGSQ